MTLTFNTQYFMKSISCLYIPTFRSQASKISEKFSLYLKAFIQNLVQNGPVVSEKIRFEFLYVQDLGPRSSNDLDLQYSILHEVN